MKLSVSLSDEELAILDRYVSERDMPSRSAAIQLAIRRLDLAWLAAEYEAAHDEWDGSEDATLWDSTSGDGLTSAPR